MVVRPTDSAPIGDQQVIKGSAKLSRPSPVIEDTHDVAQKLHHEEGQQGNPLPSSSAGTDDEANDASDKQETEDAEDRSLEVPPSSPTKSESVPVPSQAHGYHCLWVFTNGNLLPGTAHGALVGLTF